MVHLLLIKVRMSLRLTSLQLCLYKRRASWSQIRSCATRAVKTKPRALYAKSSERFIPPKIPMPTLTAAIKIRANQIRRRTKMSRW